MSVTRNKAVNDWVAEMAAMTKPDSIVWIDGTEEQLNRLRGKSTASGEIITLNGEKLPGCYLHRSATNDVARVENRTFICSRSERDAGPTNNWADPDEMYAKLRGLFEGSMAGRVMYVIPFSMAVPESPFAKFGIELTDSIYVVLNMAIVTRIGTRVLERLEASEDPSDFTKGLHSIASLDPENRYIVHFPEDNAIWSVNSGYGGNVLLGKKCLALRLASRMGRDEGWLAEHMLILGIENPRGEVRYISAAFPSACGKTNLAMLIPPDVYQKKGYKAWCVGDDIAWLRVGADGRLWAVNPEAGFFGVAPGTNMKSNANAMLTCQKNTIFTNVAQNLDDNTVWWEKMDDDPPRNALDWKGDRWNASLGTPGAHPNSRFTAPAKQCPCISPEFESPGGVPISAIVFGGRRGRGTPLVYQARDWDHGVFVGSTMGSETTAAATGAVGVVRRDPMAMLPFCGYHMGDYFAHWLDMGRKIPNPPGIFHVNWFRRDESGDFLWPGYGENMRVVEWIINRVTGGSGASSARETPIGFLPRPEDICMEGLDISPAVVESLLAVDKAYWMEEVSGIHEFYSAFGDRLPARLMEELGALERNLR
ncbi:MAG: phosphoenolpyruvate carboxykinase (GTP) [Synergistaceae bacterium]|jgi:phosphoenolpyruvate carboxykinase (GTP)|nr:phosphoenolpyruvate carboxykinase (GTP) [Synergistaceae bacterium]